MKNLLDKYYKFNNPNKIEFLEYELEKDSDKESFEKITQTESYEVIKHYINTKNYNGAYLLMNYLGYKLSDDSSFTEFNSFIKKINSKYYDDIEEMFRSLDCYDEEYNTEIDIYLYSFMFFNLDYIKFCHAKEYNTRSENIRHLFDFYFLVKYNNNFKFDLNYNEINQFVNDLSVFLNSEHSCSYVISSQILIKINQNDLFCIFKEESNLLDIKNSFKDSIIPDIKQNLMLLNKLEPILNYLPDYFSFTFEDFYSILASSFNIEQSYNFDYFLKYFSKYNYNINSTNSDGDNFAFLFIKNQQSIFDDDYNKIDIDIILSFLLNRGSNLTTHKNNNGENIGHILLNNDMLSKYLVLFLFNLNVDLWVADNNNNSIITHIRDKQHYSNLVPVIEHRKIEYDNLIISNKIKSTALITKNRL